MRGRIVIHARMTIISVSTSTGVYSRVKLTRTPNRSTCPPPRITMPTMNPARQTIARSMSTRGHTRRTGSGRVSRLIVV